jgi:hypothetical protein
LVATIDEFCGMYRALPGRSPPCQTLSVSRVQDYRDSKSSAAGAAPCRACGRVALAVTAPTLAASCGEESGDGGVEICPRLQEGFSWLPITLLRRWLLWKQTEGNRTKNISHDPRPGVYSAWGEMPPNIRTTARGRPPCSYRLTSPSWFILCTISTLAGNGPSAAAAHNSGSGRPLADSSVEIIGAAQAVSERGVDC